MLPRVPQAVSRPPSDTAQGSRAFLEVYFGQKA